MVTSLKKTTKTNKQKTNNNTNNHNIKIYGSYIYRYLFLHRLMSTTCTPHGINCTIYSHIIFLMEYIYG